jgi:glycolate oxidase iron-sulfur subunit
MIPKRIADLDEALANCMKCGFCKAACPVFIGEETTSPRAKVRLARAVARGELEVTPGFKTQMERCLNCRACADECPSGVEPNKIALAARCAMVEQNGLPLAKRLIFSGGLKRPRLMALGARALGIAQHVSAIDLQNNPLRSLLPLAGMRRDKDFPVLGRRSLFATLPESLDPVGEHKITVAYFPGCAANLIYPEIGIATVSVLRKLGARVIVPHDLVCCSTPVWNSGDIADARELAARNIEILSSVDAEYVITSCGSCGLTISQEWTQLLGLSEAEPIARKIMDISDFVAKYAPDGALGALDEQEIVTYHDPCHLRRGMGVYKTPRQLLKSILGNRFVEMELADRCCGGGGAFSIAHPELSQTVAGTKMECVAKSGAGLIVTGCPSCVMQLRDSVVHRGMDQKAIHTIEIIDRALRSSE